jgi:hypothetical protein
MDDLRTMNDVLNKFSDIKILILSRPLLSLEETISTARTWNAGQVD